MFDLQGFLRRQVEDNGLTVTSHPGLPEAQRREPDSGQEFLATNGLGTYASAGLWGENSRKYHGLFVCALNPPVERTVMLSRIDEVIAVSDAAPVELATNLWRDAVAPQGFRLIAQFAIYPSPTWVYQLEGGTLIKQIALIPGKQQAVVGYTWLSDSGKSASIELALLANYRSFHAETRGAEHWLFEQNESAGKVGVKAFDSAQELVIRFDRDRATYRRDPLWYWGYRWPRETERGLNDAEDCHRLGFVQATIEPGASLSLVVELGAQAPERVDQTISSIAQAMQKVWAHQKDLLQRAGNPQDAPQRQLVIAADQFIVRRDSTGGASVIAGYHWFNDWGRDSMISLPGLVLATGRSEVARSILGTFAKYESEGMLPNNFPDSGETPAYNTSDATLWWAWALYQYHKETGDLKFVSEQLPDLDRVVEWHKKGTRHNLHLDSTDALITGGEPGVQLTWMDAKVGDFVVTPRQGKAVEICALWYNFLKVLSEMYRKCIDGGMLSDLAAGEAKVLEYEALASQTAKGMAKFWNEQQGCLYDVISETGDKDGSIRPNQLIALSLPFVAFSQEQGRQILSVVEKDLYTPFGMRTLSANHSAYRGVYGCGKAQANQYDRDVTYHQGTAWPWLFGPWVEARLYVYGETAENAEQTLHMLESVTRHLSGDAGLGSISEIFDGNEPYVARGCIAQAWSVAELLRVRKRLLALTSVAAPSPVAVAH